MKTSMAVIAVLTAMLVYIFSNKLLSTNYSNLSENDKIMLQEYHSFYQNQDNIWEGYDLRNKPILVFQGNILSDAYLINPSQEVNSIFAKEIQMPDDFEFDVYRIAKTNPKRLAYINGNFNTTGADYSISGVDNIFYVKTDEESYAEKWNSRRFMPFLSHEAFHYYVQDGWQDPSFRGLSYSEA